MSCPTCDHTMQSIQGTIKTFWCPRCGTLKFDHNEDRPIEQYIPRLVERAKTLADSVRLTLTHAAIAALIRPVDEATRRPDERDH